MIRSAVVTRTEHVKTQIVELTFRDQKASSTQVGTGVSPRFTRASSDASLVQSWLATFDPIDSAQTLVLYRRVSSDFIRWMESTGRNVRELTSDDLAEWRDQLQGKPATRANRLAICKSLLSYAHETGYSPFNVGKAVRGPKVDIDADARSLSELQVGLMIQAAAVKVRVERARAQPRPRYLRAAFQKLHLVRFLYYSGCRVAEAVGVRWGDLQQRPDGDYQVSILGKGRKRRTFPLPRRLIEPLVLDLRPAIVTPAQVIFSFGPRRAQSIIGELSALAGLEFRVSPHWLRHAAASHALDRGAPVHVVQQSLGHASLATTTRYSHRRGDGASKYLSHL